MLSHSTRRQCPRIQYVHPSYFLNLFFEFTNTTSATSTYFSIIVSRLHVRTNDGKETINNQISKMVVGGQCIEQSCQRVSTKDHGL